SPKNSVSQSAVVSFVVVMVTSPPEGAPSRGRDRFSRPPGAVITTRAGPRAATRGPARRRGRFARTRLFVRASRFRRRDGAEGERVAARGARVMMERQEGANNTARSAADSGRAAATNQVPATGRKHHPPRRAHPARPTTTLPHRPPAAPTGRPATACPVVDVDVGVSVRRGSGGRQLPGARAGPRWAGTGSTTRDGRAARRVSPTSRAPG